MADAAAALSPMETSGAGDFAVASPAASPHFAALASSERPPLSPSTTGVAVGRPSYAGERGGTSVMATSRIRSTIADSSTSTGGTASSVSAALSLRARSTHTRVFPAASSSAFERLSSTARPPSLSVSSSGSSLVPAPVSSSPSSLASSQQHRSSGSMGPHPGAAPAVEAPQSQQSRLLLQQHRSSSSASAQQSSGGPTVGGTGGIAVTLRPASGFLHPPTAPAALASSRTAGQAVPGGPLQPRFHVYGSTRQAKVCPYCGPGAAGGYGSRSGGGVAAGGGGSTIVFDASSGDQICRECGFVVEEKVLSEEQEWRNFSAEAVSNSRGGADRNRVGEALDVWLDTGGVGTSMLVGSAGGLAGGSRAATAAKRLQQLHEATTANFAAGGASGSRDKQLKSAFACLRLIGEAFALRDNVLERAKEITKDLMENQQYSRTRNNTTTMLAVTYLACREAGVTRTVKELVVYDRAMSEKELGKAINRIKKLLPQRGDASSAESATQLLPRYCSRLQLSVHISDVAEHVAKRAVQVIISSHRPNSIAGAAIWLVVQLLNPATNPHLPKASEIASVTGAGEHTLRSICKDMLDVAEHLLPREFQPTIEGGLDSLRARNTSRKRKLADGAWT